MVPPPPPPQSQRCSAVPGVDIVWDEYEETDLKAATRRKHDQEVRERVVPKKELPRNWSEFLRDGHNKEELFRLSVAEYTTTSASQEKNFLLFAI